MPDITLVNPQLLETMNSVRFAVNSPEVAVETGSNKAFNFVAQAAAMAIQDATDNLRNLSTVSTTAIGVAMTQLVSSGDIHTWAPIVNLAQGLVTSSANDLTNIGNQVSDMLRKFPPAAPEATQTE